MSLLTDYQRDGYLICCDLVDVATVAALREETVAIACGRRGAIEGVTPREQDEEIALKDVLAIHFPHKLSQQMLAMLRHPPIVAVLRQIVGEDVKCMQSMLFVKNAGKPGQAWHQDETFIPTPDASLTGVWIALDDATIDNGCLWVQPGGHRTPMRERFVRHGDEIRMEKLDDMPWPDNSSAVAVEAKAGSLVCFHGLLPHYSAPNRSPVSRHAYTLHVTDGRTEYSPANWIQRDAAFPARGFL
jgi:phytanoyl-CoA hydroxylase